MRIPIVTGGAAALLAVVVPNAFAVDGAALRNRDGVVVSWQAGSKSAVVVTRDNRVYVVHSLRRFAPGTQVRVQGVKWGTSIQGVKWGTRPSGVKWGIKLARNGTFQSGLVRLGKSRTMALRGTVIKRVGKRGVAVSVRGAVVVLPVSRTAVWLPGGKLTKGVSEVGSFGSKSVFKLRVDYKGRVVVTGATQVALPVAGESIPFAGKLAAIDAAAGTITVNASENKLLPISLTITTPASANLSKYRVGDQVAGTVVNTEAGFAATALSRNGSFAAGDDPTTTIVAATPDLASIAKIKDLQSDWKAGFDAVPSLFTQQGRGLYESLANQLKEAERAAMRGDTSLAVRKVAQFIEMLSRANDGTDRIDPDFRDAIILSAQALRAQLAAGSGGLYAMNTR